MKLRPYQEQAAESILQAFAEGQRRVLAVLATGCGKTVLFASIIDRILSANYGKRAMVMAHRAELIWQARDKIGKVTGRGVSVEMGDYRSTGGWFGSADPVVVSTVQTQNAGGEAGRMANFDPDDFALVIVDEAHHAVSASYRKAVDYYLRNPKCVLLGVTATPDRSDEEALGKVFDSVAFNYDVSDAIADGWLVPIRQQMVTITGLDFSQMRTTAGDLNGGDLAEEMEKESNLYGVSDATVKLAGDTQTLIFCASVAQAERLAEILNRYKPGAAASISGKTSKDERAATLQKYHDKAIQYLVNCAVFTEGFDEPDTRTVVIARPTKSRALYAQMIGRGTRPASTVAGALGRLASADERKQAIADSGKQDVLVLDFAGNAGRHKLVTAVDILGGCGREPVSDEVLKIAKELVADAGKKGRAMPAEEALEEARKEAEARRIREAARRAKLRGSATFAVSSVDPFDTFNIQRVVSRGWDRVKKPSAAMVAALRKFGIPKPEEMTFRNAQAMLSECITRAKDGRPSYKQLQLLRKLGVTAPIPTHAMASRIISERLKK